MAKFALLIGVSEYQPGLTSLPGAEKDVKAMQQVLQNPEIGDFDEVKTLSNCDRQKMEEEIERLFSDRQRDDLVILYFSGHGIKDDSGNLYFATCITRKNPNGNLIESTAVAASFVQKKMKDSRLRRLVVILDCCFSGAFAEGLSAKDDGFVDIKHQLGGEGRAVLTSSTSIQYSFEQQGENLSIYTQYIVEGIETGAADRDQDGWISVDELHEYAKSNVQEASPAMNPQIYAIREGYNIQLAKAPIDDPMLKYRREVEYWARAGGGQISDIGRRTLDVERDNLELTAEQADLIKAEVLKPYQERERKLQQYEEAFREAIQRENPISNRTHNELKRFQKALRLTDEIIAKIENRIIAELPPPTQGNANAHYSREKKLLLFMGFSVGALSFFGAGFFVKDRITPVPRQPIVASCQNNLKAEPGLKISWGREILLKGDTNLDKEAGVQAFANNDFQTAIDKFKSYREVNYNDPETLIYLNNAQAVQNGDCWKIAVSVPIGDIQAPDNNIAKEMLRGVAQAQNEVNQNGGINGNFLQVAIAKDENNSQTAKQVAIGLVNDQKVLGVVGPFGSDVTKEAGSQFESGSLVAITPTSTSVEFSNLNRRYVFRTVPSDKIAAQALANYMVTKLRKKKFAIFFNDSSEYSRSLKNEFVEAVKQKGGQETLNFNLYKQNFNAATSVKLATEQGAEVLMLAPDFKTMNNTLEVVKEGSKQKLTFLGGDSVYRPATLNDWREEAVGIVLAVPWHIDSNRHSDFVQKSNNLWKGDVNWRTALAYDATQALIAALKQNPTRDGVQKALSSPNFSTEGATGRIQFLTSGDRRDPPVQLVTIVRRHTASGTQYKFEPFTP